MPRPRLRFGLPQPRHDVRVHQYHVAPGFSRRTGARGSRALTSLSRFRIVMLAIGASVSKSEHPNVRPDCDAIKRRNRAPVSSPNRVLHGLSWIKASRIGRRPQAESAGRAISSTSECMGMCAKSVSVLTRKWRSVRSRIHPSEVGETRATKNHTLAAR